MAEGPAFAFQRAVFSALSADAGLRALLPNQQSIYDEVPAPNPNEAEAEFRKRVPMPYVVIGDDQVIDDSNGCGSAWEIFHTLHIWSRGSRIGGQGRTEAKRIGDICTGILDAELAISGFVCVEHEFRNATYPRDTDGVTVHGILVFRYLVDPSGV